VLGEYVDIVNDAGIKIQSDHYILIGDEEGHGNSTFLTIDDTNQKMFYEGGDVGIGTNAPSAKLDIISSGGASNPLQISASTGSAELVVRESSGNDLYMWMKNDAGVENVRLHSDNDCFILNNLGIGTTSPDEKLDVAGNVNIQDTLNVEDNVVKFNGNRFISTYSEATYIGLNAGNENATGDYNELFGCQAGQSLTTGVRNVCIGYKAGNALTDGTTNVFIGWQAGEDNVSGTGNVFIGHDVGASEAGSNKLYIANDNTSTPLIYGEFNNDLLNINGELRIYSPGSTNSVFLDQDEIPYFISEGDNSTNDNMEVRIGDISETNPVFKITGGSGDNFYFMNGDVGIGIPNPQRVCHIGDVLRLEPRATAPSSPAKGDIYVGTDGNIHYYNGTQWSRLDMTPE